MELKIYPDSVLKKKSRVVKQVTDEIVARAQEMLEFMYEADGLGLAAPQVGWSERIVTLDVELEKKDPRVFVNPAITAREGHQEEDEGCLSLPGLRVKIPRAAKVNVVAYTLAGDRVELEAEGLAARAWQHELDHLNGLLLIDRLSPTTLMSLRDLLKKLEQEAADRERQGA